MTKKIAVLHSILRSLGHKKVASQVSSLNWIWRSPYFSEIDVGHFISQNSDDLEKIERLSEGRFFFSKSGAEGTAYFIGDDSGEPKYVFKINFIGPSYKLFEDSRWEAKILESGIFDVKYNNGREGGLSWKVSEKLNTDGVVGSGVQDIIDIALKVIEDIYREILLSRETVDFKKDRILLMQIDSLNPEVIGEVLSEYNLDRNKLMNELKSSILSEVGSLDEIESNIPSIKPGWLEDFILSIIDLLVEGKNDFGEDNVGIREETGRLTWFDA